MLLEVKNLGIAYGDKPPIVQGVTFNLDEGEILAIVGESGSGKTTVIRAIQHVLPGGGHIAEGQVIFEGEDTQKQTPEMLSLRAFRRYAPARRHRYGDGHEAKAPLGR